MRSAGSGGLRRLALLCASLLAAACNGSSVPGSSTLPPYDDQVVVRVPITVASAAHPAIWFRDDVDNKLLVAFDWSGRRVGELRVLNTEPFGVMPSPDGSALVLMHAKPTSGGVVIGRAAGYLSWADDSVRLCSVRLPDGSVYTGGLAGPVERGALFVETPETVTSRHVVLLGDFTPHGGPRVLSCSAHRDQAVVAETFVAWTNDLESVTLSSAQARPLSLHPSLPVGEPPGVVTSPDGSLIAFGSSASVVGATNSFSIYATDTGRRLTAVDGSAIVGFSADNTLMVTVSPFSSSSGLYRVVNWRTMRVIWSGTLAIAQVTARPSSSDVLFEPFTFRDIPGGGGTREPFIDPLIVHADGSTTTLPEVRPAEW